MTPLDADVFGSIDRLLVREPIDGVVHVGGQQPVGEFAVAPMFCRASSIASWRMCDSRAAFADDTTPYDGTTRVEPSEVIA